MSFCNSPSLLRPLFSHVDGLSCSSRIVGLQCAFQKCLAKTIGDESGGVDVWSTLVLAIPQGAGEGAEKNVRKTDEAHGKAKLAVAS